MFEKELLEDTQYAFGLLNAESGGQLNSNNSITGAKLLYGVKRTNSNEGINFYLFKILKNYLPIRNFSSESGYLRTFRMNTT